MNGPGGGVLLFLAASAAGWALLRWGRRTRRVAGLTDAVTLSLDSETLRSRKYRLIGRPDRLIRENGLVIPEEWKSSLQVRPWHVLQLGVYLLLIEESYGRRPPHGYIVCGDGTRHRIDNDERLRAEVLGLAERIRAGRRSIQKPIPVTPERWQCRPCGVRRSCGQARL